MRAFVILPLLALALTACTGAPSAEQRRSAQDELNQSGRPYNGPPGITASFPPADPSATPLRCHIEGPGEVCDRSDH
jgi:hypothetical protein